MPEMMPDPIDKLARFTPSSAGIDSAAIIFAAGRAAARTPWGWKLAAAVLLVANAGWLVLLGLVNSNSPAPGPQPAPLISPESPVPSLAPNSPAGGEDPFSYHALLSTGDPEIMPRIEPLHNPIRVDAPMTARSMLMD